jgi:hypothetical protein
VPLWEIGRSRQLLSCKELENNRQERRDGTGRYSSKWPTHLKHRRWSHAAMLNRARHPEALEELAAICEYTNQEAKRFACFGLIRGLLLLYRFHRCADFKEKQKVPHSYSRAEENARFANGVRDDEAKQDYINPEIALIASGDPSHRHSSGL